MKAETNEVVRLEGVSCWLSGPSVLRPKGGSSTVPPISVADLWYLHKRRHCPHRPRSDSRTCSS